MSVLFLIAFACLLVISPVGDSVFNIPLLPFLGAPAKQDHQRAAVAPEVNPVAGTKIDSVFEHALANGLHVGKITLLDAGNCRCYLCSRDRFQFREPIRERATFTRDVITNLKHE
jgi:hypothetical protein